VSRLLAAAAVLALVEVVVNLVLRPQSGPAALAAVFEPHLLALGAVCGAVAILLTLGERTPVATWIRVIGIAVLVVAIVRVGGEWWSPGSSSARAAAGATRITVMSWNLEVGSKAAAETLDGILQPPRDEAPDVVALQELTPDAAAAIDASAEIDRLYPYRILEPQADVRGMGILSRLPLVRGTYGTFPMLLTATALLDDGSRLAIVDAHPLPPRMSEVAGIPWAIDSRLRDVQLEGVRAAVDRAPDAARVILVGDLNVTPFEPGYGIVATDLEDAHASVGSGTGFTWRPHLLEGLHLGLLRIDHVLTGAAVTPVTSAVDCSLTGDHCRLTVVLDVAAGE
jgi:endonuclease/exonuclease/phosphatase family metal-dependent hydrolase